jgi:hypothetical protein
MTTHWNLGNVQVIWWGWGRWSCRWHRWRGHLDRLIRGSLLVGPLELRIYRGLSPGGLAQRARGHQGRSSTVQGAPGRDAHRGGG